ncbi:hypothetical protein [Dietzia sp.]|uniref:hypothetical protein n=1 Tax=Dietzia sp. TaxID=1871616 RepID=UPI002FDAEFEF
MRITLRRAGLVAAASAAVALGAAPLAAAQSAELPTSGTGEQAGSAQSVLPGADQKCELPGLGGSLDAILPYLGLSLPSSVTGSLTSGLDEVENPLAAAGFEVSDLGAGSLEGPLCTVIFGGKMVDAPETTEETSAATTTTEAEDQGADTASSLLDSGSAAVSSSVPTTTEPTTTADAGE